ncbi:MAG: T9SS C-terminal target domain-containing protein, partial [Bacteroidota bacterium]
MKKIVALLVLTIQISYAQIYPPAAGQSGSTAISAESASFVGWATNISVERGFIDISNPSTQDMGSNIASFGLPEDALGLATNTPVSLGDGGIATLTFDTPISDGPGFDFAVFENSFNDTFLELAFVEVSSDG